MDAITFWQQLANSMTKGVAPAPAAPGGIGPGGTSPPVVTPPFLPGNLSNVATLGQRPVPQAPAPLPLPSFLDLAKLAPQLDAAFTVPDAPTLPKASQRAPLKFADPTNMVASMRALAPKNPAMEQKDFEQKRFADAMAAAALASTQADGLGSIIAAAGGAFGQAASGANEQRREEMLRFEETNRAFEAQMAQLNWDVDQAKTEQENATSDLEFDNALARETRAREQLMLTMQQQEAQRAATAQKLGLNLDVMQFNAGQENARTEVMARNQDRAAAHAAKYEPQWSISEDGSMLTQTYLDPTTGKMVVHQEPVGVMGQMQQIAQLASTLPNGLGNELIKRAVYDNMARIAPQMMKRQMIMDILDTPGGEKVFDPQDAKTSGVFGSGTAANAEEYFNVGKTVWDQISTSDYEAIINKAEQFVNEQVNARRLTPEQATQEFKIRVAQALEPYLTPEAIKRAQGLNNPDITYGLGLLK